LKGLISGSVNESSHTGLSSMFLLPEQGSPRMDSPQLNENYGVSAIQAPRIPKVEVSRKRLLSLSTLRNISSRIFKVLGGEALLERVAIGLEASPEPQIRQKYDSEGRKILQVYDPLTKCSQTFRTEDEFQVWYEKRFQNLAQSMGDLQSTNHAWRRWNR
jgi:hypothetical protein